MMSKMLRVAILWLLGGFLYCMIEVAWRGYSHSAMFIVGGFCFVVIGGINEYLPWTMGLVWQALLGAAAVTAVELVSGLILNRWLKLGIWDYADMPFNVLGQICLPYCAAWVVLSAVGIWLDDTLRYKLFGEDKPHYTIF